MIQRLRWRLGHWLTRDEPSHVIELNVNGRTVARSTLR